MDKVLILNKLCKLKNFSNRSDFAKFLEVSPQTVTNWYYRNTFDLEVLVRKFPEVRPLWLINGEGEMLQRADGVVNNQTVGDNNKGTVTLENQNELPPQSADLVAVTKQALKNEAEVLAMNKALQTKLCELIDKITEKM